MNHPTRILAALLVGALFFDTTVFAIGSKNTGYKGGTVPGFDGAKDEVFVSCGQWSESERSLGKDICDLIRTSTSYEPYFAQNQSGLDGLTTHILEALDRAAAFLGVMHHEGRFRNVVVVTDIRSQYTAQSFFVQDNHVV